MSNDMKQDVLDLLEKSESFYDNLMHYIEIGKEDIVQLAYQINDDLVKLDVSDGRKLAIYLNGAINILSRWDQKQEDQP